MDLGAGRDLDHGHRFSAPSTRASARPSTKASTRTRRAVGQIDLDHPRPGLEARRSTELIRRGWSVARGGGLDVRHPGEQRWSAIARPADHTDRHELGRLGRRQRAAKPARFVLALPLEQEIGVEVVPPGHHRHRSARRSRLLDDPLASARSSTCADPDAPSLTQPDLGVHQFPWWTPSRQDLSLYPPSPVTNRRSRPDAYRCPNELEAPESGKCTADFFIEPSFFDQRGDGL